MQSKDGANNRAKSLGARLCNYESLDKITLEKLARAAIRQHRSQIAADEVVYDEWSRLSEDTSVPLSVKKSLQDEYLSRSYKSAAQQLELSSIIEALGFVPDMTAVGIIG